ncbi:MAG: tRNA uridine-5-carboxymethylaminomethyl(34) synthesis enzyme MnmG [Alphaproteobacteria bacterium]|nr:tRNA uridine-5-carboxymethylaminomethyl(34) synthesis enzyme MnmG [Alphaproteobacteria bacterium]
MKHGNLFDVVIIGGGHAGCEAAAASARVGAKTLLLTHSHATIGTMSCNPAIGGLGKGHLVREIDALDGIMARAIDRAGIQFRMLNQSKGPAVRGPRAQADRQLYATAIAQLLAEQPNLSISEGAAGDIILDANQRLTAIVSEAGEIFLCGAAVITSGTFLGGVTHVGHETTPAGRFGELPSRQLATRLRAAQFPVGRLKTGTPPRLLASSIDWQGLTRQDGDDPPQPFSFLTERIETPQIACYITATTPRTHQIIADNLSRSAIYAGNIAGVGPRYCPSIEDKITRFAERNSHQIFLEPEGLDDPLIYPNGISTSLPREVQSEFIASIPGLQRAVIARYGYAIEYDFVDPRSLKPSLESKLISGLFLAGQINGTTGYEEAAGQGLLAGINAARMAASSPPLILSRSQSYLGVMLDDLITQGVTEPYRMFTARSEFRLRLRADNADQRLTPLGIASGCVSSQREQKFRDFSQQLGQVRSLLDSLQATSSQLQRLGFAIRQDGVTRSAMDLLRQDGITPESLSLAWPEARDELMAIPSKIWTQMRNDSHYSVYLDRLEAEVESFQQEESLILPVDLDFSQIGSLSTEIKEKLELIRPLNLGMASRIPGMTPVALMALLRFVRRPKVAQ